MPGLPGGIHPKGEPAPPCADHRLPPLRPPADPQPAGRGEKRAGGGAGGSLPPAAGRENPGGKRYRRLPPGGPAGSGGNCPGPAYPETPGEKALCGFIFGYPRCAVILCDLAGGGGPASLFPPTDRFAPEKAGFCPLGLLGERPDWCHAPLQSPADSAHPRTGAPDSDQPEPVRCADGDPGRGGAGLSLLPTAVERRSVARAGNSDPAGRQRAVRPTLFPSPGSCRPRWPPAEI